MVDTRSLLACSAISKDSDRLKCFDNAVRTAGAATGADAAVGVASAPVPGRREPMVAAPASAETAASASTGFAAHTAPGLRIASTYGFGVGDHTGSFNVLSGDLKLQSFAGSSGDMASAQVWLDRWPDENWTIGLEYLAFRNEGKANIDLPAGLSILTDPVTAGARVKVRADIGFLNIAYRTPDGSVRPFLGGGIGIGYGTASVWYNFSNAFLGSLAQSDSIGKPIVGVQGFTGVEIDLTSQIYLAVMPRIVVINAHPIGIDQQYMVFGVDGVVGWRF